jgi:SAM-dependent methyltransferase
MPDLSWNAGYWGGEYDWPQAGEEWSAAWGGSEAQWFGALYPRLHRLLPARRILEIAPGRGRWTRFLLPLSQEFIGVDLSADCVEVCRRRFADFPRAEFKVNDGLSLEGAEGPFDFVFSFDSLVHAEIDVFERYVPQILARLAPDGAAFVHHSNFAALGDYPDNRHWRGVTVSGERVAGLVEANGGEVLVQEVVDWTNTGPVDCFTTFARKGAFKAGTIGVRLENHEFMKEASLIGANQSRYARLARAR